MSNDVPHSKRLRAGRVSLLGQTYLLTTTTADRNPLFVDFEMARCVVRSLKESDHQARTHTWACVVMPDHFHWLVTLESGSLSDVMKRVKSKSAVQVNALRNTPRTSLWQVGFHDRAVRNDEDLRVLGRYVVANPVRAGIVASVRDYSHWYAAWL